MRIIINQEEIGERIATYRKNSKLTQEKVGELLNVSDKTVSKWERGKSLPDILLIPDLCEILNISISELLTGKKEKKLLKFSQNRKQKNTKNNIIIGLILLILFISIMYYYKDFQIYNLSSNNDNYIVNGYLLLDERKKALIIDSIKTLDNTINYNKMKIIKINIALKKDNQLIFSNGIYNSDGVSDICSFNDCLEDISIYEDNINYNLFVDKMNIPLLIIEYLNYNNSSKHIIEIELNVAK